MEPTRKKVNVRGAMEHLGCCRQYVYRLYEEGKIEGQKCGERKGMTFFLDSIVAHLERNQDKLC